MSVHLQFAIIRVLVTVVSWRLVPFEPWAGTDIYVPAKLRSEYLLANKGYVRHEIKKIINSLTHAYDFIALPYLLRLFM